MRALLAVLMWLVATLAATLTIGAGWAATHVQDEDGFVTFAAELGEDPEVRDTAASLAGEAFADQPSVPPVLHDQVAAAVTRAVTRLTGAPGWDDAWRETTRRTHERLFAEPTPDDVRVDVAPIVRVALDEATADLPVRLPSPDSLLVVASEDDPEPLVTAVSRAKTTATTSAVVAVVAALLALVLARGKATMTAELGLGLVLAAGTWWLIGRIVLPRVVERATDETAYGRALSDVLTDRVATSLDGTLVWVAAAGAVVMVVGLISRARRS